MNEFMRVTNRAESSTGTIYEFYESFVVHQYNKVLFNPITFTNQQLFTLLDRGCYTPF